VLPGLGLAGVLEARGRDISRGGIGFQVAQRLSTDLVYLHFREAPHLAALALLARVTRVQQTVNGLFEVGTTFSLDTPGNVG